MTKRTWDWVDTKYQCETKSRRVERRKLKKRAAKARRRETRRVLAWND